MLNLTIRIVLVSLSTTLLISPVIAETKCEVKTTTCIDAQTGIPRICHTTICKDDKGDIVSINTIVLKEGSQTGGATGPKVKPQLQDLNVNKKLDKASPN